MSPVANDRPVHTAPPPRRGDPAPEPEQRARFEDALSRREPRQEGKQLHGEQPAPDLAQLGHAPYQGFDLTQDQGRRDRGTREEALAMLDGLRPAPAPAQLPADAAPSALPQAAALPTTHAEFAQRLDLPTQPLGGEFQLSMSDTRWLASHAVVARDNAGGLSLDVSTNSDSDAEAQRAELRARLEARGHRIDRIDFAG
ncbi:hypothetical protein COC42_01990 [Sphingomonas spermidinifaciens]|uniref:Uncharacterized protein n=1 Tax=Sphingomonas spermidinifaciens TaxID=1141889 RepID=A0A2A4B6F6_9SPHN|nr:hypothetical protein [Sphingomonas spermidinifaciens]PCD03214.1 hypothetical protein COC42_01990 [Sphingomonas spermidinifaciens]